MKARPVRAMPESVSDHRIRSWWVGGLAVGHQPASSWRRARSTSTSSEGSSILPPPGPPDVEGVDHSVAQGLDLGGDDVEIELGQSPGDAVEHAHGVGGVDLDDGRAERGGVVDEHPGRLGQRPLGPAPAVDPGPLGQAGLQGQTALEGGFEVADHLVPADRGTEAGLHLQHVHGHPVHARRGRVEDAEAVQGQHAGDAAEEAGPVVGDDGEAVALTAQHLLAGGDEREVLAGGEVLPHVLRRRRRPARERCGARGRGRGRPSTGPRRPVRWPGCRPR